MRTSELSGAALDWAVAKCERTRIRVLRSAHDDELHVYEVIAVGVRRMLCYSTDWAQGGPIIERKKIDVGESIHPSRDWTAAIYVPDEEPWQLDGPTPLVAAMRCYVASRTGVEIEIPDELLAEGP